jgi:SAM-dependent methyltransferase
MRRFASFVRRPVRRAQWAIEDRRLTAEQRRGVLGPAHSRWRGNSSIDNRERWSGYDWGGRGEEWNASPEWKQSLIDDVLARWIPSGAAVLEIGPGAGRWSEVLAERALRLVLVDVSERPLELCRERFNDDPHIQYVLSSGKARLLTTATRCERSHRRVLQGDVRQEITSARPRPDHAICPLFSTFPAAYRGASARPAGALRGEG